MSVLHAIGIEAGLQQILRVLRCTQYATCTLGCHVVG